MTSDKSKKGGSATKPSNSLSHGLSSRAIAERRIQKVNALATAVIGNAPRHAALDDAARSFAEATLHLDAIRRAKLILLNGGVAALKRAALAAEETQAPGEGMPAEAADGSTEFDNLVRTFEHLKEDNGRSLVRLIGYERKGISRRNRLMRRISYLILELKRWEDEAQKPGERRFMSYM